MPLDVIVLAAGQGKRMRSDLPKVLHPIAGRPLLAHVLDTARALREINAGFMALNARLLDGWLGKIGNRNAQKEYYLTDIVKLAVKEGARVAAVKVDDPMEVAGVNSKAELAALERAFQAQQ